MGGMEPEDNTPFRRSGHPLGKKRFNLKEIHARIYSKQARVDQMIESSDVMDCEDANDIDQEYMKKKLMKLKKEERQNIYLKDQAELAPKPKGKNKGNVLL
eukprot:TRINITY_DN1433_c0_g1_i13.p1 TRINITY_DN1433_c0_g1~~TRINITY_DN1433_c0_g1_i13.p1  ORF type:complete len:101 (-),score=26.37 TRINITY_DN1433_c0_g1_i13:39-341(-)